MALNRKINPLFLLINKGIIFFGKNKYSIATEYKKDNINNDTLSAVYM